LSLSVRLPLSVTGPLLGVSGAAAAQVANTNAPAIVHKVRDGVLFISAFRVIRMENRRHD
jgi:hypothetical protein